ncbi:hypothetical protein [Methylobacterium indicum]|uniref:Uncharacterized protein n=1 Tax=Methylobacterium indicum TaxID=1775910 RepID=A0A8H8X067_9HYPH|nr:hypothetical protein [Methylobacterium indicum]BCM87660.1 hypothetical protein mvi_61210 [Methylobacterium indicum]
MGEYVMTTMTIGGVLQGQETIAALIAAAGMYFAEAAPLVNEALTEGRSVAFEDVQDFGLTPNLDRFCQTHGLPYQRAWIARPGMFEAGVKFWKPGMGSPVEEIADEGGQPMMTLAALRNSHDAGETLPAILARLEKAVATAVPPLTLANAAGAARQAAI